MSWLRNKTTVATQCAQVQSEFSPYLDGTMSGVEMQAMSSHMAGCRGCASEFEALRALQGALHELGPAKAPADLQARLRAALAEERALGTHLAWHRKLAAAWRATLAPVAFRVAAGTVATLLLVGGVGGMVLTAPSAVEANDEPLGAMTAPHFLYSEVPPQPIEFGHDAPVLVEAMVDDQGRVYDYTIVSGPTDPRVERRVQANLLSSVFRPATVFGIPVAGRVIMTYSGISVRG